MTIGRLIIGPQASDTVTTTDATANVELLRVPIPDTYAGVVEVVVLGIHSTDDVYYLGYHFIERDGVAATYGGVVGTEVRLDNGSAAWGIGVSCDGTDLLVDVTGAVAHTINWGGVGAFPICTESFA